MKSLKLWICSALFFLLMTLICGLIYTGSCTAIAQVLFPYQANGSIIEVDGVKYGSELVGQQFHSMKHMWGRPMYAHAEYHMNNDGDPVVWYKPSNLSPASTSFEQTVARRVNELRQSHPDQASTPVPSDLVTCSGSGFDPHISIAAARYQVGRLAKATGKSADEINKIIDRCTCNASFGFLGEEVVDVLKVNLMLDGILK